MVYCGKPSKACAECRTKRTKCDALRPSCSQCRRAGRTCWGYKDPVAWMFRDENARLQARRRTAANFTDARTPRESRSTQDPYFVIVSSGQQTEYNLITPPLFPSADEQATCFFFQNYVLEDSLAARGHFEYLPELFQTTKVNEVLSDAVTALGLAGLANQLRVPQVMFKANLKYSIAVRSISSILGDSELARQDQTLISVMLLSMYESIASQSPRSLRSWTHHLKGATTILRLRGKQQLRTELGRRLFVQIRAQISATSLQRRVAVPDEIQEWSRISKQYETPSQLATTNLFEIAVTLASIRSTMEDFQDYRNSHRIISQSLELDNVFTEWLSQLPSQFFYDTVKISTSDEEVFSDQYHIYSGICIATTWNNYRCLRIVLNELLIDQMIHQRRTDLDSPQPDRHLIQFYETGIGNSISLLDQLTIEMCASVPYYFDYQHKDIHKELHVPAISGNLLLWCLYTAAVAGRISDHMRFWIVGRLRAIGETMGIHHAFGLAEVLSEKREISVWETSSLSALGDGDGEPGEWNFNTRKLCPTEET